MRFHNGAPFTSKDVAFSIDKLQNDKRSLQGAYVQGIEVETAELTMIPKASVHVDGEDVKQLLKLLEALEDLDDVQKVHSNLDIDESAMVEA